MMCCRRTSLASKRLAFFYCIESFLLLESLRFMVLSHVPDAISRSVARLFAHVDVGRDHVLSRLEHVWGPGDGRPVEELKVAIDQVSQAIRQSASQSVGSLFTAGLRAPRKRTFESSHDFVRTRKKCMAR